MKFARPSELRLFDFLRRRARDGEIASWVHEASVYDADPVALTARYGAVIADDGAPAWYFVCTPVKKNEETDARISRVAGKGTWKGERGRPLYAITDGVRKQVGWRRTFSYLIKVRGQNDVRLGWIMTEFMLPDGTETCVYKMYRSPRLLKDDELAHALNLSLAPQDTVDSSPSMASSMEAPDATSAHARGAPAASSSPAILGPTPPTAGASSGAIAAVSLSSAHTGLAPPPAALAHITRSAMDATAAAPASDAPATPKTSPPKKWVHIEISDSPTKASDKSSAKRVYRMILPVEEGTAPLSAKKPRTMDCKGWLTLEPVA